MLIRTIICCSLIVVTQAACESKPWNAAVRFEGGSTNPQVPLRIELRSGGGQLLFSGVLERRCLLVQLPHAPSLSEELLVDVSDVKGMAIGAVRFRTDDREARYIPVDGQLGVVTVHAGVTCK